MISNIEKHIFRRNSIILIIFIAFTFYFNLIARGDEIKNMNGNVLQAFFSFNNIDSIPQNQSYCLSEGKLQEVLSANVVNGSLGGELVVSKDLEANCIRLTYVSSQKGKVCFGVPRPTFLDVSRTQTECVFLGLPQTSVVVHYRVIDIRNNGN